MAITYTRESGAVTEWKLTVNECAEDGKWQWQMNQPILRQVILDQSRQNRYQTVPFGVYIHNLVFVFILE